MPDDLLRAVRCLDAQNTPNVFQDAEAVGDIFPEKSRVCVQHYAVRLRWVFRNHGELNPTVADIGVKDSLEAALVADLTLVHGADSLRDWQDLGQFQSGETRQKSRFDCLDFVIKKLDLVCALLSQIFVQKRHFTGFERLLPIPILKVSVDTAWVNDLI